MTQTTAQTERTLVTFLLDRSGSMGVVRGATIEAFNAYLAELKSDPEGIDFTFLQFDTESLDKLCVAEPVARVADLTLVTYQPRGGTPLIDAAYKTIKAVETALEGDTTTKVVICIQTDGEENSSREHTWEGLTTLIKKKTKIGWQFNFMGAGIDAYAQGAKMGIAAVNTMAYDHLDRQATTESFVASAVNTRSYARGRSGTTNYSASQRLAAGDRWAPPDLTDGVVQPVSKSLGMAASSPPVTTPSSTPTKVKSFRKKPSPALDLTKPSTTTAKPAKDQGNVRKAVKDFAL